MTNTLNESTLVSGYPCPNAPRVPYPRGAFPCLPGEGAPMVITNQKLIEIMSEATGNPSCGALHEHIPAMANAIHEYLTEPIDDTP